MTTRVGRIVKRLEDRLWLVDYPGNVHGALAARALASVADELAAAAQGHQDVLLVFDGGDARAPVIVGSLAAPRASALQVTRVGGHPAQVSLDGQTLVLQAGRSVSIQCGESALLMHADGTVIIKGRRILTRASESNRVRGSTVCIN